MESHFYPSYDDLMKGDSEVEVKHVNQAERLDTKERISGGLSTVHIIDQMSTNKTRNPFEDKEAFLRSSDIQKVCSNNTSSNSCLAWTVAKECPKTNMSGFFYGYIPRGYDSIPRKSNLENELKKRIVETQNDGIGRGMLISAVINRSPLDGELLKDDHAVSMTVQNHSGELSCTGMDSNMFFAKGKGKSACDKIAKKMDETLKAYAGSYIYIHTAKK